MNLPPKTLPALVRQRMLVRIAGPDPDRPGESLPVLEAFQRYLDGERAQARRRLTALVAVFAFFSVLLIAGISMVALLFLSPWQEDMADAQKRLSELQSLVAGMEDGETALVGLREETEQLRQSLAQETERVAGMRAQADEQAARHRSDMLRMGEVVKRLTDNHRALNRELANVKADRSDLDEAIRSVLADRERRQASADEADRVAAASLPTGPATAATPNIASVSLPELPIPERMEQPRASLPPLGPVAAEQRIIEMNVRPRGWRESVRWRMSIPPSFAAADSRRDRDVRFQ